MDGGQATTDNLCHLNGVDPTTSAYQREDFTFQDFTKILGG